jgi:ATP-dependent DNA helicase RecG
VLVEGLDEDHLKMLRLANLESHARLLAMANDDVALFLKQDPNLSTERGKAMQILLYLFEKNDPLSLLQSG